MEDKITDSARYFLEYLGSTAHELCMKVVSGLTILTGKTVYLTLIIHRNARNTDENDIFSTSHIAKTKLAVPA